MPGEYTITLRSSARRDVHIRVESTTRRRAAPEDARWVALERRLDEAVEAEDADAPAAVKTLVTEVLAAPSRATACEEIARGRRTAALLSGIGRSDEAVPVLARAVAAGTRCGSRYEKTLSWLETASLHLAEGRFDSARQVLDEAARRAAGAEASELRADVELARGQLDTYEMNVDSARERYARARSAYQQIADAPGEARTWLWAAYNEIAAGAPERALDAGAPALRLSEQIGDRRTKGRALQALALANQVLGRTQRGLELYLEARNTLSPAQDSAEPPRSSTASPSCTWNRAPPTAGSNSPNWLPS